MADEEDLWLRLDCALLEALREPVLAWGMAWSIAMDAAGRYPELIAAAEGLMSAVDGTEPDPDLVIRGH